MQLEGIQGMRIVALGSFVSTGMKRGDLKDLIESSGASLGTKVDSNVSLVIAAGNSGQSDKAREARGYGIQIMTEMQFWNNFQVSENGRVLGHVAKKRTHGWVQKRR